MIALSCVLHNCICFSSTILLTIHSSFSPFILEWYWLVFAVNCSAQIRQDCLSSWWNMVMKSQKWQQCQLIQIFLRIFLASICVVCQTRNYLKVSTLEGIIFSYSHWSSWFHFPCLGLIVSCSPRNKRKHSNNDEPSDSLKAMDDIKVVNGLECKISCKTSKVWAILIWLDIPSQSLLVGNRVWSNLAMP